MGTKRFTSAVLGTLLITGQLLANHGTRNLDPVENEILEAAQLQVDPAASPSERAQSTRMKAFHEALALQLLTRATFAPVADSLNTLQQLEDLDRLASTSLSVGARSEVDRLMIAAFRKDVMLEGTQRSFRQLEFALEDLATRSAREWSQTLRKSAYDAGFDGVSRVLESRVVSTLCARSSADLDNDARMFEAQANDFTIEGKARQVYSRLAGIVRAELAKRVPPPQPSPGPSPVVPPVQVCLPLASVREVSTLNNVDPALGAFLLDAPQSSGLELDVDLFGIPSADSVYVSLDTTAQRYLSLYQPSRSRVRLSLAYRPTTEITVSARLTVIDYSRRALAEVVLPITIGVTGAQIVAPQPPIATTPLLFGTRGGRSIEVRNGGRLDLIKGESVKLNATVLDQYGLSMGTNQAMFNVTDVASRVDLSQTQDGGAIILAKNVSDWQDLTVVDFEVNSFGSGPVVIGGGGIGVGHGGGHGGPVPPVVGMQGRFTITTSFAKFNGFSPAEAQALTERLYKALLHRPADYPGANGYINNIRKNGFKGLADSAVDIANSQEGRGVWVGSSGQPDAFLNTLYVEILGRQVDPSGAAGYINDIRMGRVANVVKSLVTSTEFRNNIVGR